jgi:cation diffusion facilitator CzcD-associated flavoprotein CzcO
MNHSRIGNALTGASYTGPMDTEVLVVGAGPAGLATAACLVQRGMRPLVIEKGEQLATSWRSHYERLHLHTVRALSSLPGLPFPATHPRYVSRQAVVDYLAAYAERHGLAPQVGEEAIAISPIDAGWQTSTAGGRRYASKAVVIATGANSRPNRPAFAQEESYRGRLVHSGAYRNAAPFVGQRVLVVGMGNTGAEIALDLAEHGVRTAISMRSPVNIVHREVLGGPIQLTSIALSQLPARWGDTIARMLRDLTVGDLSRYGIPISKVSPLRQLREFGKTPVIDVGTLARIKSGDITVHPGIEWFTPEGARFAGGAELAFDAVILATGYHAGVERLFPDRQLTLDRNGMPAAAVGAGELAGVYFVGFDLKQPGGMLRAIGRQAQEVAQVIARARNG